MIPVPESRSAQRPAGESRVTPVIINTCTVIKLIIMPNNDSILMVIFLQ